ncbi:hypothetical protein PILCRDRAFT_713990 [Piloderma croceum F 1598]|uniref:Uncharacterized protein n=1 Tax=Piloderma croceum (strain F 1598) TaxID=765440 RepID=A0A0C3B9S1_PILCF|nr:hypothetical protein PILCRDRAFT_713990 [Piloderma croceum F 1598]
MSQKDEPIMRSSRILLLLGIRERNDTNKSTVFGQKPCVSTYYSTCNTSLAMRGTELSGNTQNIRRVWRRSKGPKILRAGRNNYPPTKRASTRGNMWGSLTNSHPPVRNMRNGSP